LKNLVVETAVKMKSYFQKNKVMTKVKVTFNYRDLELGRVVTTGEEPKFNGFR